MKNLLSRSLAIIFIIGISSCNNKSHVNLEVLENSYSGSITISSALGNLDGDFTGNDDSGTYYFVWCNPSAGAVLNLDVTAGSGSVQFLQKDARGTMVFTETIVAGGGEVFTKITENGKKGKWLVKIIFSNFDGNDDYAPSRPFAPKSAG